MSILAERAWTPAEDAVLRDAYLDGGSHAAVAALRGRSLAAIHHRVQRLGLFRRRRWTEQDDARLCELWESGLSKGQIAQQMARTPGTLYHRAQQLGLSLGVPRGNEYITNAAKRTGYAVAQLRRILNWSGRRVHQCLGRTSGERSRSFHYVDPMDVDDAIAEWHATEPLEAAARRVGMCAETLARRLRAVGVEKPKKQSAKAHWRVRTADVERAVRS